MKKQISSVMFAIIIATFNACAQEKHEHQNQNESPAVKINTAQAANPNEVTSIKEIVSHYLEMKNAFVSDNTNEAATAGKNLESAFKSFDKKSLNEKQKKVYDDIEDDAREHAEHIGANGGNIEHQREHFIMLSKDMYDLVKALGIPQP